MTTAASALIADIGATNARFALLEGMEPTVSETYAVADYASPIEAARPFPSGPAARPPPNRGVSAARGGRSGRTRQGGDDECRLDRRFGAHLQGPRHDGRGRAERFRGACLVAADRKSVV